MEKSGSDNIDQDAVIEKTTMDSIKQEADTLRSDTKSTATTDIKNSGPNDGKKAACKKHGESSDKKKDLKSSSKKSKKTRSSDSESSSSSSSSSDDTSDEEDDSDSDSSSSESDTKQQKRRFRRAKARAKKLKERAKKARNQKKKAAADEDSSDSDEDSSEDEKIKKKNARSKAKARKAGKRKIREDEESDEAEVEEDPNSAKLRLMKAQLARLGLETARQGAPITARRGRAALAGLGRRDLAVDEALNRTKAKQAEKAKKKRRASKVAFKRVDHLWDQSIHNYKLTETIDDPDENEFDQYIFTVRRKFDWEHKYQETLVDIKSKYLKEALKKVMTDVKGVSLVQDTPHVDPNMLFLYLEESRAYMKELKEASRTEKKKKARKSAAAKAQHLKVLVKYLDKDYAETKKTLYPLLENKLITFDLLWALFKPNTIAYCSTYGDLDQPRAFKIDYATKVTHFLKGTYYSIEGRYLEYDGKSFGMGVMHTDVSAFLGSRKISSLDCCPLQYHKDPEALRSKLIERGKKFVALKGMNYRSHKGMAYTKRKRQILKININGRIMVDPAIHRRINPNYPISTVKPKEDQDIYEPSEVGSEDDSCQCGGNSSSDEEGGDHNTPSSSEDTKERKKFKVVEDEDGQHHLVEIETDEHGDEIVQKENLAALGQGAEESFSNEELLIASPVVLGFAFSEKLWLEFTVSGISDIVWNEGAFDSLVLPDNQKSIVKALVSSHAFHPSRNIDDIITGKGKGLVAVLHGPPGTGKTLTAEGIADLLKCPLYMVSAGDLGTDPRNLEKELQNILDIAHSWGALLLLDEADVFLEKRSIHDIHRNALVSIFLRLLEYFQGILFLTTNRVETFDEAFVSRIHLSLRYGELSLKAKKTVWKMFIEKVKNMEGMEVTPLTETDYTDLAKRNINGRQIKNLTRAAQALAVHEAKPLSMSHIRQVLEVAETFEMDLKGGTGYMDAMRGMSPLLDSTSNL